MKSIYKVILSIWISILSQSVFALDAPAGLSAGDQFYVMFKSTTKIRGDKTVVEYNNLVNTDADANGIGPTTSGLTWSALMNHEALDLNTGLTTATEQTLSLFAANIAAPVYTAEGTVGNPISQGKLISVNRAGLFDGTIDTAILYEADGVTVDVDTVWTGSDTIGGANLPLGTGANTETTEGVANASIVDNRWIDDTSPFAKTNVARIYAVSPLLQVDSSSLIVVVPVVDPAATPAASDGGSGGGMDWSLLMFFLALTLLRAKTRK